MNNYYRCEACGFIGDYSDYLVYEDHTCHRCHDGLLHQVVILPSEEFCQLQAELDEQHDLHIEQMRLLSKEIARLKEALEDLMGEQNGPPLIRDAHDWQNAMDKAAKALKGETEQ